MTRPTPSRGRTLRNLTVNVFHPFELLPATWKSGHFDWDPALDEERGARLGSTEAVVAYAERITVDWTDFLLEAEDALAERDPLVSSPRGEVRYSALLASQRWHAGFHYRQLVTFLAAEGRTLPGAFALESLADLELPAEVF